MIEYIQIFIYLVDDPSEAFVVADECDVHVDHVDFDWVDVDSNGSVALLVHETMKIKIL